ncbi:hypothetical protein VB618_07725 [Microvirga sp. CF3062]|uniref:hypothetical protein n=1 Tax=Microvirga sp. CF3062 TaxID=3110182 RepID=UPI002E7755B7|nr:hypothetical protein [Microvirga sp. CF3062]MEE1656081.1 hypothetical protein [Microvirga sp. CF3062]
MTKAAAWASIVVVALALAACNQSTAGSVAVGAATALDPTGLSGAAVSMAQSAEPEATSASMDFSSFALRLRDVAAGNTARPDHLAGFDQVATKLMADQAAGMAQTVGKAAVDGALTGGVGLVGAVPVLAKKAVTAGMIAGTMASARGQASASIAQAEAQRAAEQFVPDPDRPAEAQAILSILDQPGRGSAAWQNPQTGASGKVTIKAVDETMFGGMDCRLVRRELKGSRRTGEMLACRSNGEWYDLS